MPRTTSSVQKISIALPPAMVDLVRNAVDRGEYASSSEVIREALRDWHQKRSLQKQGSATSASYGRKPAPTSPPAVPPMKSFPGSSRNTSANPTTPADARHLFALRRN